MAQPSSDGGGCLSNQKASNAVIPAGQLLCGHIRLGILPYAFPADVGGKFKCLT